jgi:hypothetical protein
MIAPAAILRLSPQHLEGDRFRARCWGRKNLGRPALWAGFCLALTVLLVYRLAAVSAKTSDPLRPGDLLDDPTSFDAFSEPSVACAILRQEAERLLWVYREDWDREQASQRQRNGGDVEPGARPGAGQSTELLTTSANRSGLQTPSIESLRVLDAQVQDVQLSLTLKLLLVYADHQMWNEFVDRYLQLPREGPGRAKAALFVRLALDCSEKCGRTEEVVDALQHMVRFHPELKSSEGVKEVLAEWKIKRSPSREIDKR